MKHVKLKTIIVSNNKKDNATLMHTLKYIRNITINTTLNNLCINKDEHWNLLAQQLLKVGYVPNSYKD